MKKPSLGARWIHWTFHGPALRLHLTNFILALALAIPVLIVVVVGWLTPPPPPSSVTLALHPVYPIEVQRMKTEDTRFSDGLYARAVRPWKAIPPAGLGAVAADRGGAKVSAAVAELSKVAEQWTRDPRPNKAAIEPIEQDLADANTATKLNRSPILYHKGLAELFKGAPDAAVEDFRTVIKTIEDDRNSGKPTTLDRSLGIEVTTDYAMGYAQMQQKKLLPFGKEKERREAANRAAESFARALSLARTRQVDLGLPRANQSDLYFVVGPAPLEGLNLLDVQSDFAAAMIRAGHPENAVDIPPVPIELNGSPAANRLNANLAMAQALSGRSQDIQGLAGPPDGATGDDVAIDRAVLRNAQIFSGHLVVDGTVWATITKWRGDLTSGNPSRVRAEFDQVRNTPEGRYYAAWLDEVISTAIKEAHAARNLDREDDLRRTFRGLYGGHRAIPIGSVVYLIVALAIIALSQLLWLVRRAYIALYHPKQRHERLRKGLGPRGASAK